eukprot:scaffold3471_cov175-Amphora_coffeaeformis.AAC.19
MAMTSEMGAPKDNFGRRNLESSFKNTYFLAVRASSLDTLRLKINLRLKVKQRRTERKILARLARTARVRASSTGASSRHPREEGEATVCGRIPSSSSSLLSEHLLFAIAPT